MPLSERLRSFLESRNAEFNLTQHANAFTAREVAAAEHLPAREVAKTVIVFADGVYHMIVVPASKLVDLIEVRPTLGFAQVRLAREDELSALFPDCELGAMPPFGPLYGFPVYLDASLAGQDTIAFNAGSHREVIHMHTAEFRRLVSPTVVSLAREPARI
ncbi:MAG: YbaK/prolyl-tRNA synthetase associated region [Candidatus Solibacter sp.]|jgi:Ala-tRNA(Pro) deacylase|nr:YbaK/prolyl-tRNA synthetase associated region [Candidatus Solibacter sp.]